MFSEDMRRPEKTHTSTARLKMRLKLHCEAYVLDTRAPCYLDTSSHLHLFPTAINLSIQSHSMAWGRNKKKETLQSVVSIQQCLLWLLCHCVMIKSYCGCKHLPPSLSTRVGIHIKNYALYDTLQLKTTANQFLKKHVNTSGCVHQNKTLSWLRF